jgi:hypothetical protein
MFGTNVDRLHFLVDLGKGLLDPVAVTKQHVDDAGTGENGLHAAHQFGDEFGIAAVEIIDDDDDRAVEALCQPEEMIAHPLQRVPRPH